MLCQARKDTKANALNTVRPNLQGVVRNLRVFEEQDMVSSWTFFLLVGGEVYGSEHHYQFGSKWSGVYVLVGRLTSSLAVNFPYLVGLSGSTEQLKDGTGGVPWWGAGTLPQDWLWLLTTACSSLVLQPLSSPINNCLGKVIDWMKPVSYNQRNRGPRKAFVPRSPTGSCFVSASQTWCWSWLFLSGKWGFL